MFWSNTIYQTFSFPPPLDSLFFFFFPIQHPFFTGTASPLLPVTLIGCISQGLTHLATVKAHEPGLAIHSNLFF